MYSIFIIRLSATIFILFSALPTFGLALPATGSTPKSSSKGVSSKSTVKTPAKATATSSAPPIGGGAMTPSDKQIMNAVMSWMNDTGKVTKFLNTATSFSGDEYTRQATIALNAEKDELNHKMVLDAALGTMKMVQDANDTLATQGTFQAVVDTLQSMVDNGPDTAQAQVDSINMNRCVNVLPNIDMYFAAAGKPDMTAVRPTGCLEIQGASASTPPPVSQGNAAPDATSTILSVSSKASAGKNSATSASKAQSGAKTSSKPAAAKASASASSPSSAESSIASDVSVDGAINYPSAGTTSGPKAVAKTTTSKAKGSSSLASSTPTASDTAAPNPSADGAADITATSSQSGSKASPSKTKTVPNLASSASTATGSEVSDDQDPPADSAVDVSPSSLSKAGTKTTSKPASITKTSVPSAKASTNSTPKTGGTAAAMKAKPT